LQIIEEEFLTAWWQGFKVGADRAKVKLQAEEAIKGIKSLETTLVDQKIPFLVPKKKG
jgi:hypothetical protein